MARGHKFFSDRELHELGMVRAIDGVLLDNRDDFYADHPDPVRTFDSRTMVAVSKTLFSKMLTDFMREEN